MTAGGEPSPFRIAQETTEFAGSRISVARVAVDGPGGGRHEREIVHHPGEAVRVGQVLSRVHASTESTAVEAVETVRGAFTIGAASPAVRPVLLDRFSFQE